jgi:hypothetical protein
VITGISAKSEFGYQKLEQAVIRWVRSRQFIKGALAVFPAMAGRRASFAGLRESFRSLFATGG